MVSFSFTGATLPTLLSIGKLGLILAACVVKEVNCVGYACFLILDIVKAGQHNNVSDSIWALDFVSSVLKFIICASQKSRTFDCRF